MFPRAIKIVNNFQWIYQDFYQPYQFDRLVYETAVIMGDQIPTTQEIAKARTRALAISTGTVQTSLGAHTRGTKLSPFDHACLLAGGYSYGPI